MGTLYHQMSVAQIDALAGMLGFPDCRTDEFLSRLRVTPAVTSKSPTLRDFVDAYLDNVRERVGL